MTDLTPILQAVRQAAQLCQEVQQRHVVRSDKAGHEPVTIADYGSQAIICRALKQAFPQDGVMAEESGKQFIELVPPPERAYIINLVGQILGEHITEAQMVDWLDHGKDVETARLWVIDPIDGTKGFLGQRHYVNAVGVLQDRRPVGGVIAAPAYPGGGRLLYAWDGVAYREALTGEPHRQPIHVTKQVDPSRLRGLESVEKSHAGLERLARARALMGMDETLTEQADSMEKYCRIASGDAEVYMRLPRLGSTRPHNIWDHAPGVAILEAAGGKATDVDGSPLDFSTGRALNNYGVIATNGAVHDLAVQAVQALLKEEATATG